MKPCTPLPPLAAPANRALASAGITCLEDFARWDQADVARLHGIGPNAMKVLKDALEGEKNTPKKAGKSTTS